MIFMKTILNKHKYVAVTTIATNKLQKYQLYVFCKNVVILKVLPISQENTCVGDTGKCYQENADFSEK